MAILNKEEIYNEYCNAIFITFKEPNKEGIHNEKIYVTVYSQKIDDYLLDELIRYNSENKFVKNIIYFTILDIPDPENPLTWVVNFEPSMDKWIEFSSNLLTLGLDFAFINNELRAEHFISCKSVTYIFVGATQNFKLFEGEIPETMDLLNNSLKKLKLLVFNDYGKVQMSQNCIDFTNNLIRRGVKFVNF